MAPPEVREARALDAAQLAAIAALESRVVAHDGGRLKLEWGALRQRPATEANDLLAWEGDRLVGFCGIYVFGREPELAGAVDPAYRRQGLGTALFDRATALLAERARSTALLVVPRTTDAGRRFAEVRGARFAHAEHHMELDRPPARPIAGRASAGALAMRPATDADRAALVEILEDAFGEGAATAAAAGPDDLALVVEREATVVACLRLSVEGQTAGVYGLAVKSDVRGQGIGRAALSEVCLEARRQGAALVTLEVAVDNDHALGLYTSVGFELRTTEDYFRVAI